MIKAIIVDDEPLAQDVLETYISQIKNIELVGKCDNAIDANAMLKEHVIDLMFLDIQMPQLTGIEFLKSLSNPPKVIFTTAYSDYAVEGFELDAIDYLLKPISIDRFLKAVNKAEEIIASEGNKSSEITDGDYMFVKADKKLVKVNYDDVLYIEGLKDYVIIKMETERVITLQTMKSLEAKLPQHLFKRIHRSYIIKTNKIKAIMGNMVEIKERNETKLIPIGKNYKEELLAMIEGKKL